MGVVRRLFVVFVQQAPPPPRCPAGGFVVLHVHLNGEGRGDSPRPEPQGEYLAARLGVCGDGVAVDDDAGGAVACDAVLRDGDGDRHGKSALLEGDGACLVLGLENVTRVWLHRVLCGRGVREGKGAGGAGGGA